MNFSFFFSNVSALAPFIFVIGSRERRKEFFSVSDMISYSCILVQGVKVKQVNCHGAQMVMLHNGVPLIWSHSSTRRSIYDSLFIALH